MAGSRKRHPGRDYSVAPRLHTAAAVDDEPDSDGRVFILEELDLLRPAIVMDDGTEVELRKGDVILCDFDAPRAEGETVTFDKVLMLSGEGVSKIGKPTVAGASVSGEVLGIARGEKLIVFRFRRRKNVRKKRGHRQLYTKVRIQEVNG